MKVRAGAGTFLNMEPEKGSTKGNLLQMVQVAVSNHFFGVGIMGIRVEWTEVVRDIVIPETRERRCVTGCQKLL